MPPLVNFLVPGNVDGDPVTVEARWDGGLRHGRAFNRIGKIMTGFPLSATLKATSPT
jgi:hypothetical protein